MAYEAVVFDLFGTIVPSVREPAYRRSMTSMAGAVGVAPDDFIRLWTREDVVTRRATGGFATIADNVCWICGQVGVKPGRNGVSGAVAVRREFTRGLLVPRPDAVAALAAMRVSGLSTVLMSVCSEEVPQLWPATPFAALFDAALFSCVEGLLKPDAEFYERSAAAVGASPEECVYVGDGARRELQGASDVGMRAVLICPPDEEDVILAREGVPSWSGLRVESLSELPALLEPD